MPSGFDTTANAGNVAALIKADGYTFIGRYLSENSWKVILPPEAVQLKEAALDIVLVYEDGPKDVDYFKDGRGASDSKRAIAQASALGAVAGTAIYFSVDYDAGIADIDGPIAAYFKEAAATLAADPCGYAAGVYGSGRTCAIGAADGVSYTWQAQSEGWAGSSLKFEIENSAYEQTQNLWTAMGVSYQPSIIYKIRHVGVHSAQIKGVAPSVRHISGTAAA